MRRVALIVAAKCRRWNIVASPPHQHLLVTKFCRCLGFIQSLLPEELPLTECLKDTVARVVPYWQMEIAPQVRAGKKVIVAAHGNSLRALIKHLDIVSDEAIVGLNIPTAVPLVYELTDDLKPIRNYYLGDQREIAAAQAAVANQGKARA